MRKVVHLVYSFGIGGLERVILNLINASDSKRVTHYIVTLTDNHQFASQLKPGVEVFSLSKREGSDLLCHWRLFKLLNALSPDVLQTYNFGTIEYHFTAFLAGVSTRIHAEHGREVSDKDGSNKKHNFFRRAMSLLIHHFVVVSHDLEQWAKKTLTIAEKKLHLIFNGVEPSDFAKTHLQKENKQKETFRFCSIGRLSDVKNHHLLIAAYAEALQGEAALAQSRLIIVGDGPEHDALQAQIAELGVANYVELWGYREDIAEILAGSDIFVLSSIYEAMPMTVLEAMASALPVISTRVGGVEHLVTDKQTGILVAPGDKNALVAALSYAANHRNKMQEMGANARQCIEQNYSTQSMCERYMALYGC